MKCRTFGIFWPEFDIFLTPDIKTAIPAAWSP